MSNKRGHKCAEAGCKSRSTSEYEYPTPNDDGSPDTVWLCDEHAEGYGFCYLCGGFWAGVESFDFSRIKGVCENCIVEFDDPDDDLDEFNEFALWDYNTWNDVIENESGGVYIGPDNDTMGAQA